MSSFDDQAKQTFPAEICWISSTRDSRVPVTAFANKNKLPSSNTNNKSGGPCTAAFLNTASTCSGASWKKFLKQMEESLEKMNDSDRSIELQSSRPLDLHKPCNISNSTGARRALLIGINYNGNLSSSHFKVSEVREWLVETQSFEANDITILMDKEGHKFYPTRTNILISFQRLVQQSRSGGSVFLYFAGHSGRMMDTTTTKSKSKPASRYVETLLPSDFDTNGPILADEIYKTLLTAMPPNTRLTALVDCSLGGSIITLPYVYTPTDESVHYNDGFEFEALIGLAIVGGILAATSDGNNGGGEGTTSGGEVSGDGGNVTSGATGGGNTSASSSQDGDDCCDGCCDDFFDALFE